MQINPLLLEEKYFFMLIYPEYLLVPLLLKVFAAPEQLYLDCTSMMQFHSPGLGDELLHHFEQHSIGFVPPKLLLSEQKLNLVGFLQELH